MAGFAFFDFCETLVSFQTADAFVDYVRRKKGSVYMRFLDLLLILMCKLRIITVLNKVFPGWSCFKRIKLLQLRNLSFEILDREAELYYNDLIKPNIIQPVVEEMINLAGAGCEICLVSAGYSIYLKYFAREYNIQHIISTEISFNRQDKRCHGTISGTDCRGSGKVKRIKDYFKNMGINISDTISFSDSLSDLPMLLLTNKAVVVSKLRSQPWALQHGFREIIWN
jgi:HAD superfamily hydrolase (TIGR01490 family)